MSLLGARRRYASSMIAAISCQITSRVEVDRDPVSEHTGGTRCGCKEAFRLCRDEGLPHAWWRWAPQRHPPVACEVRVVEAADRPLVAHEEAWSSVARALTHLRQGQGDLSYLLQFTHSHGHHSVSHGSARHDQRRLYFSEYQTASAR